MTIYRKTYGYDLPVDPCYAYVVHYTFYDIVRVCTIYMYVCQCIYMSRDATPPDPPRSHPPPTHARRGGRQVGGE